MWTGNLLYTFLGSIIPAITWTENLFQDDMYTRQCSNSESHEHKTTQPYPYTTYLVSSFVIINCASNCLSSWTSYLKYATTDSSGHTSCFCSSIFICALTSRHRPLTASSKPMKQTTAFCVYITVSRALLKKCIILAEKKNLKDLRNILIFYSSFSRIYLFLFYSIVHVHLAPQDRKSHGAGDNCITVLFVECQSHPTDEENREHTACKGERRN